MNVHVGFEGGAEQARKLQAFARFLVDLRPFWPLLSTRFVGWMSRQFESEGQEWGSGWAPLSDTYSQWKAEHFPGKPILSMYGDLRRAATTPRRIATPRTLTLLIEPYVHRQTGETIDPAWFQQGTDRMPARPLVAEDDFLPASIRLEIEELGAEYVRDIAARLGMEIA